MNVLRRTLLIGLALVVASAAALFAFNNPGRIDVDIGVALLEDVPASIAFAVAFAFGWLFGMLSAGFAVLKLSADRRRLRRELRMTEAEADSLRSLPLADAD